jgi:hypothetical protein
MDDKVIELKEEYQVSVSMTPNYHDNPKQPYHWVLLKWSGDAWCNEGFGWAANPTAAFVEANRMYELYKKRD